MSAATQTTFTRELGPAALSPVLNMADAVETLELDEDTILSLVKDGAISHAWDIGLGQKRMELRILKVSVAHYLVHGSKPHLISDEEVFKLLLPPGHNPAHALTNSQVQRRLKCFGQTILRLIEAGELEAIGPVPMGQQGAAVTVESFQNFVLRRRLKAKG